MSSDYLTPRCKPRVRSLRFVKVALRRCWMFIAKYKVKTTLDKNSQRCVSVLWVRKAGNLRCFVLGRGVEVILGGKGAG